MIEVTQLGKTYPGGVEAVKAVDFDVRAGEVFGLLGPNGAGKSTTIGMLTTTIEPSSGTARLAGFDVAKQPREARRVSSVVFQEPVVDRALTGRRNLVLHVRLWSVDSDAAGQRIQNIVDAFGIGDVIDRPVGSFSGGQVRRLEIARALISRPSVLFLDEPTVGLDTRIRYELLELIDDLRADNNMTTLLTTHYLDEAERLCDRVAIISAGRIVALDSPRALLDSLGREVIELRVQHDPQQVLGMLRAPRIAGDDTFAVGSTLTIPLRNRTAGQAMAQISELSTGIGWFVGAAGCFAVAMYSVAEIMANRSPSQEEYIGAVPAVAIVPWFVAGSLFPISALPAGLSAIAKALPLTHVLALMRYGLLDRRGAGLRNIWGMANATVMATLSMAVVMAYAVLLLALALRVFRRAAVR